MSEAPPPRLLPILYFGVAHASLLLAFAAVAADPLGVAGFFIIAGWLRSISPGTRRHDRDDDRDLHPHHEPVEQG